MEKSLEEWKVKHQPYEFAYHKDYGIPWCLDEDKFKVFWNKVKEWIEPKGLVLDIGCGPRPPFEGYGIEPLADKYFDVTPELWWHNREVFLQPGEEYIKELEGKFDTVVCWNYIDHTYDYKKILDNVVRYMSDDAIFALATDFKEPNKHLGHPSFPREEFFQEVDKRFEVIKREDNFQERDVCFLLKKKLV